ncbi:MAG: ankyrin repeat domain-containing protein [Brevinema sp.]
MKKWIFLIPIITFANTSNDELLTKIPTASKKEIQQIISRGANINSMDTNTTYSALMIALMEGNSDGANALIELGADINTVSSDNSTPLIFAAKYGHLKTVDLLLAKNPNIEHQNEDGSALHHASANGFLNIVKKIAHPQNINTPTSNSITPLMYAAYNGHADIVSYLFKNFTIDQSITNSNGDTALMIALKRRYPKVVKELLTHNPRKTTNNSGQTPLMIASAFGSDQNIQDLISLGCDIEALDQDQNTPLIWSIKSNQLESLKKLLIAGSKINIQDKEGNTPLIIASKYERIAAIALLLQYNADISKTNTEGFNALYFAKKERNNAIIKLLEK